ncbi:hypothetical protein LTR94_027881, partial [Friedmanniomyces endolithicus]
SALEAGEAGALGSAQQLNPAAPFGARARFLALRHPKASAWRQALLEKGDDADDRDDVLRFGFGLYQDRSDVERLIQICRDL